MRRLALGVVVAAMLALVASPQLASAQIWSSDKQNPKNYDDANDSQPIRLMSYVLAPVGFTLEWTIARPLHYIATQTPLAPVLNPGGTDRPPVVLSLPPPDTFPPEKKEAAGPEGASEEAATSASKVAKAPVKSGLGTVVVPSQPTVR